MGAASGLPNAVPSFCMWRTDFESHQRKDTTDWIIQSRDFTPPTLVFWEHRLDALVLRSYPKCGKASVVSSALNPEWPSSHLALEAVHASPGPWACCMKSAVWLGKPDSIWLVWDMWNLNPHLPWSLTCNFSHPSYTTLFKSLFRYQRLTRVLNWGLEQVILSYWLTGCWDSVGINDNRVMERNEPRELSD